MNNFNIYGFPSDQMFVFRKQVIKKYKKYFTLAIKINQMILKNIESLKFLKTSKDAIIGSLFCKCITSFQTVILLLSFGLPNEAEVVLRSLLEATFILMACCNDDTYIEEYKKSHLYQRYDTLRKILNYLKKINKDTDEYKRINKLIKMFYTSNEIKYAEDYYKKYQNYKLNISKLSKKAGMECYYYNLYPYLSMSVHNQIKTLEHYYINADTNNHQFDINPHLDKETLTFIIVSSCDVIIKTLEKIYEYQNSKFPDEFKRIRIKILSIIPSN